MALDHRSLPQYYSRFDSIFEDEDIPIAPPNYLPHNHQKAQKLLRFINTNDPAAIQRAFIRQNDNQIRFFDWVTHHAQRQVDDSLVSDLVIRDRLQPNNDRIGIVYNILVRYPPFYISPYLWNFREPIIDNPIEYLGGDDIYLNHNFCFLKNGLMLFMDVELNSMRQYDGEEMLPVIPHFNPFNTTIPNLIPPYELFAILAYLYYENHIRRNVPVNDFPQLLDEAYGNEHRHEGNYIEGAMLNVLMIVFAYLHKRREFTLPDDRSQINALSFFLSYEVDYFEGRRVVSYMINRQNLEADRQNPQFPTSEQRHFEQAIRATYHLFSEFHRQCLLISEQYQNAGAPAVLTALRCMTVLSDEFNAPLRQFIPDHPPTGFQVIPNAVMTFVDAEPFGGCFINEDNDDDFKQLRHCLVSCDILSESTPLAGDNCGIRELLCHHHGIGPKQIRKHWTSINLEAHVLRTLIHTRHRYDEGINFPLVGPLSPSNIKLVADHLNIHNLLIIAIADHTHFESREYTWHDPSHPDAPRFCMAIYKRHYFKIKLEQDIAFLKSIWTCANCKHMVVGRGQEMHRCPKRRKRNGTLGPMIDVREPNIRSCLFPIPNHDSPAPFVNNIFMDFETMRDAQTNMHQVYAFGAAKGNGEVFTYFHRTDCLKECVSYLKDAVDLHRTSPHWAGKDIKDREPLYLWFYNGSRFDVAFLMNEFVRRNIFPVPGSILMKNNQVMAVSYFDGALVFRDLCLFTVSSLDRACRSFGVEEDQAKSSFDHHAIRHHEDWERQINELREYLILDIKSMRVIYEKMDKELLMETGVRMSKRITLSHVAFDAFRVTLVKTLKEANFIYAIKLPMNVAEDLRWRLAFKGGRVIPQVRGWRNEKALHQTYQEILEEQNAYVDIDVVSLYPKAMAGPALQVENLPKLPNFFCGEISDHVFTGEICSSYGGVYCRCTPKCKNNLDGKCGNQGLSCRSFLASFQNYIINLDEQALHQARLYPQDCIESFSAQTELQPFNIVKHGAIVYLDLDPPKNLITPLVPYKDPNDNFTVKWELSLHRQTALSIDELLHAIVYGYRIIEIHGVTIFSARIPLFAKYIEKLFHLKQNAPDGSAKRTIAKLLLNGCYGKLVQQIITQSVDIYDQVKLEKELTEKIIRDLQPILEAKQGDPNEQEQYAAKKKDLYNHSYEEVMEAVRTYRQELGQQSVRAWVSWTENTEARPSKPVYLGLQVTAFSRMIMNTALYTAGSMFDPKHAIHYTDTDSALIPHKTYMRLKTEHPHYIGKELGQLDDELKGGLVIEAYYLSPKFYCLLFVSPRGEKLQKIRTKGFPHPPNPDRRSTDGFWLYDESPTQASPEQVSQRNDLPLGQCIYKICFQDGRVEWYNHLNIQIFRGINDGSVVTMKAYFNTMQRKYFNASWGNEVSGIQHVCMKRSIESMSWWNDPDCPRKFLHANDLVSVPRHFVSE